ncbi:bh protein [Bacillus sp. FJAT-27225]|uniref:bh protein n=1 Tax=Bacillus sp. FJAT-27225 TaxID=1743144 RepID=UPI00080C286E|nr:bh protein [Bacillus sp. FJAT-27225]OCA87780.1 bh protein [Bacillus sp. FJAT-27225]
MKYSEMDSSLFCSRCNDESLHNVKYLNNKIYSVECTVCHSKINLQVDPIREIYKEVYKRVTSKPTRLISEYEKSHDKFITELPKRVLSKPYRLKKYVADTTEALKKIKGE